MTAGRPRKKVLAKTKPPDSTEIILESISDGVFTVDRDWRITSFNRAAEEITGIAREEAIGKRCSEVFKASMCEGDCALCLTLETGEPVINKSAFIVDVEGRRIPISVSTALLRDPKGRVIGGAETFRDLSLVEELRKELEGRFQLGDLVSRSPAMRKVFDVLPQVAASDSTVLIQGETGTGKELVARAIHGLSPRRDQPFVAVSCGALPDTLLESELFGYKAGAFTGAVKDKPGRFALAEHGTLFLDEIGEISPALQVRLLRVLQERTYDPLGGTKPVVRRAGHRSDEPRPCRSGQESRLSAGPVLPDPRRPARSSAAAEAEGGHPASGRALRGPFQPSAGQVRVRRKPGSPRFPDGPRLSGQRP